MDAKRKAKIDLYVSHADRGVEPLFVGRKDLFETVRKAALACASGQPQGQTLCIAGPPGIGKSAFLAALRRRELAGRGGPFTLFAEADPWRLHDPRFVLERLKAVLDAIKPASQRAKDKAQAAGGRIQSVSALGFGGAVGPRPPKADPLAEGLAKALDDAPEDIALCLTVDEAHQLRPTPGREINELLAMIHAGAYVRFPLFVLLAGHSQTPDVIQPSVSRRLAGDHLVHMQPLSVRESKEYVQGVLDHCEARGSRRRLADWIAEECGGFPHHLRSAMTAVAEEMLRTDSTMLRDLDAGRIAQRIAKLRLDYYQRRTEDLGPAMPAVRAVLAKWGPDGAPSREAAEDDLAHAIAGVDAQRLERMREEGAHTPKRLADRMISRGLLAADSEGERWRCVIPSLHQHVLGQQYATPPPPNLRYSSHFHR